MSFQFEIGDAVAINPGGAQGVVIARAEYAHSESNYQIRYLGQDGLAREDWWAESALTPVVA